MRYFVSFFNLITLLFNYCYLRKIYICISKINKELGSIGYFVSFLNLITLEYVIFQYPVLLFIYINKIDFVSFLNSTTNTSFFDIYYCYIYIYIYVNKID